MSLYDEHANDGRGMFEPSNRHKHMTGNKFAKKKVATLQSKEKAWEGVVLLPVDPEFVWYRQNGCLYLKNMSSPHIFNALKKAMNNMVNELINRGHSREEILELLEDNFNKL